MDAPNTKIIADDNKGSITFDFPPGSRYIPGIGTSRRPEIVSLDNVHDVILVSEPDAVATCNYLLKKYGLFLGGSSGAVIYAAKTYLSSLNDKNVSFVCISPDFGEKYVNTIYNPIWVEEKFGSTVKNKVFYVE